MFNVGTKGGGRPGQRDVQGLGDPMGRSSGAAVGWRAIARVGAVGCCCLMLAHCGGSVSGKIDPKYGVSSSPRVVGLGEPVPKGGGTYRVGKPYTVAGRIYVPEENASYSAEGLASWYGDDFHGRQTANGEVFDMTSISAAHPTLPIPSYARVTNLGNQRSIIVRVNDRGPYHQNRVIDVSIRAAKLLGFHDAGVTRVRVDYVGRAALEGSDDTKLEATLRRGTPAPGPAEVRLASSRPFLPQSGEATYGPVPLPADRPYELGHDETATRVAQRAQPSTVAAVTRTPIAPATAAKLARAEPPKTTASAPKSTSRSEPAPDFSSRFEPAGNLIFAPAQSETVPAFAPAAPGNAMLLTGRGLY
jgi:rare lipoprotein A